MANRKSYYQLGIVVDAIQIPEAIAVLENWIEKRGPAQYVAVTGMHGMTEAQRDPEFKRVLNEAGLVVPDGMPLVLLARYHGFPLKRRVYGPELMLEFCRSTVNSGYRHFFYGGAQGVAQDLSERLRQQFPGLIVAGTYTPPFRPLTLSEENEIAQLLANTKPDILWVGLSTPKQEKWMFAHRHLPVPVMVGVGAAFDLNTGRLKQAPKWMREHGLEWLFRLLAEPKRLWRRYLVLGPKFLLYVLSDITGTKKFE